MSCPNCEQEFVPAEKAADSNFGGSPGRPPTEAKDDGETYRFGPLPTGPRVPETNTIPFPWDETTDESERNGKTGRPRIVAAALPPPPRWTFFSNVFLFPWSPGALIRWSGITVGVMTAAELAVVAWEIGGTLGIGFVGLGVLSLGLLTVSYALSVCLAVILDTAEGYDTIEHWPESDWRIWFLSSLATGWLLLTAIAVGAVIRWSIGLDTWWAQATAVFILFPILVLSSIESGSALIPLSGTIARSLRQIWWGWAMFYLQSALLLGLPIGLFRIAALWNLPLACLLSAPAAAAVLLISARLLGRVGWLISTRLQVPETEAPLPVDESGRVIIS